LKIFKETQRFDQWWLIMIEVIVLLVVIISFIKDYRNNLDNDLTGMILVGSMIVLVFGLVHFIRLETVIDENGISYRFFPILSKPRKILWSELTKCFVRKYSAISEYGGWGIRGIVRKGTFDFRGKGRAFNIKGNMGIQLEYLDGGKLLIGTQQPENAKRAIEYYSDKINSNSLRDY